MKILAGSNSQLLGEEIAARLGAPLVEREIGVFPNGEKRLQIQTSLRSENVALVQALTQPVDEAIIELLLMIDALERLGTRHLTVVVPWLGYSLQDKVFRLGEPLSAKVIANLISHSYTKRVILQDLHNHSIPGFFSVPTLSLSSLELFAEQIRQRWSAENLVIASPDFGGLKRARELAKLLDLELINIDKTRDLTTGQVYAHAVHGSIQERTVLLYDDCIVSGGTVSESAKLLKERGARQVHFLAAHGLLSGDAQARIAASPIDSVLITDSIQHETLDPKINQLSVAPLYAEELANWQ